MENTIESDVISVIERILTDVENTPPVETSIRRSSPRLRAVSQNIPVPKRSRPVKRRLDDVIAKLESADKENAPPTNKLKRKQGNPVRIIEQNETEVLTFLAQNSALRRIHETRMSATGSLTLECESDHDAGLPLTVNYLPSENHVKYDHDYEVFSDEVGFTVCHAAPMAVVDTIAQPVRDSPESPTPSYEEQFEAAQTTTIEVKTVTPDAPAALASNDIDPNPLAPNIKNLREFMYKDVDLATLGGTNLICYSVNVLKVLFTHEELANGLLPDENNNIRSKKKTCLDQSRVEILKKAIMHRFDMTDVVFRETWRKARAKVNTRISPKNPKTIKKENK